MDKGDTLMCRSCDSYIFLGCGHYKFFNIAKIERYRLKSEEVEKLKRVTVEVYKIVIDRDNAIEKIERQLQKLKKDSKNKYIAVRKHEEISLKKKNLYGMSGIKK